MRVDKWKVLGIAGALVLSYVVTSDAAQIKVSDDTFADLGYWMKVRYTNLDERVAEGAGDWRANVFDVVDARFNIEGQITKVFQFYGEVVTTGAYTADVYRVVSDVLGYGHPIAGRNTNAVLSEGGINLVFLPELQLRLGKIRIPFTRDQQEARYSYIIQSDWIYDPHRLFGYWRGGLLRLFEGGANLHGEIMGGVIRYDLGIFNEASSDEPLNNFAWAARLEFSPPILGFKPETKTTARGWLHDTYLGKRGDVLTIGLSYFTQDVYNSWIGIVDNTISLGGSVKGGALLPGLEGPNREIDVNGWNIDLFLEKRLGSAILNLEGAYVWFNDSHYVPIIEDDEVVGYDKENSRFWYVQGNLLYDCVVGIGKPALYAKYEHIKADVGDDDLEMARYGLGVNYYVKGNAARLTVGVDWVRYDDFAEDLLEALGGEDSITDFYVQAQIMF